MNIHMIKARDLPDLWFQAVNDLLDVGKRFKIDRGSFAGQTRLEYDYFIGHVKYPGHGSGTPEILPQIPEHLGIPNPVEFEYVYGGEGYERSYIEYVMTDVMQPGESYTYGQRLSKFPVIELSYWQKAIKHWQDESMKEILIQDKEIWEEEDSKILIQESEVLYVNQIELAIWTYKNKGHRNNQMVLQVAKPDDMLLQDPPCLRSIDTRIQSNEEKELTNLKVLANSYVPGWPESFDESYVTVERMKKLIRDSVSDSMSEVKAGIDEEIKACEVPELSFVVYFRSWDLWAGLPANLAGIQALKEYMAAEIGVGDGDMIVESKGLHLYGYAEDLGKIRCIKDRIAADGGACA